MPDSKKRCAINFCAAAEFTAEEFYDTMEQLARECVNGSEDIPRDHEKSNYWRKQLGRV